MTFDEMLDQCVRIIVDGIITDGFKSVRVKLHIVFSIYNKWYKENE